MRKKIRFTAAALLLLLMFEGGVAAQTLKPQPVEKMQVVNPKAEIVSSSEKIVKGAPFSADAVSESVQILYDGNRIVQRSSARLYRDSAGRFRRDELPKPVGIGAFVDMPQMIFILDPVLSRKIFLYPDSKTARQLEFKIQKPEKEKKPEKSEWEIAKGEEEIKKSRAGNRQSHRRIRKSQAGI